MYEDILIPATNQVASASQFGNKVRDAILDLDRRVAKIESTLSNYAFKPTATTRASTTTVSNDPHLQVWLEPQSKYFVEVFLSAAGLAAADIKTAWSPPGSALVGNRRVIGTATGGATNVNADDQLGKFGVHLFTTEVSYNLPRNAANLFSQIQEVGLIENTGGSGYLVFQWAQVTSNATGTVLADTSFMRATKLV